MIRSIVLLLAINSSFILGNAAAKVQIDVETMRQQNLDCHNHYRKLHGVPPLEYNAQMNRDAQVLAEQFSIQAFELTSPDIEYGMGIHKTNQVILNGSKACENWYSREHLYEYGDLDPLNKEAVSLFTQMISRACCYMGVGVASSGEYNFILVLYDPPGNIDGEYGRNVFPVGGVDRNSLSPFERLMLEPVCTDASKETYLKQNLECLNLVREMNELQPFLYSQKMIDFAEETVQLLQFDKGFLNQLTSNYERFAVMESTGRRLRLDGYRYCNEYEKGFAKKSPDMHSEEADFRYTGFATARVNDGTIYTVVAFSKWNHDKTNTNSPPTMQTTCKRRFSTQDPQVPTVDPSSGKEFFKSYNLDCHDKFRRKHGVEPLTYSNALNEYAQAQAEGLALHEDSYEEALGNSQINIYSTESTGLKGTEPCQHWYGTGQHYDYIHPPSQVEKESAPFTLMMWKHSRYMGIGLATSASGRTYVVAAYDPRGNTKNEFKHNILQPGSTDRFHIDDADLRVFRQQNLDCHNNFRDRHQSSPLDYNSKLTSAAETFATKLASLDKESLKPNIPYGVNIFVSNNLKIDGSTACNAWYSEYRWYRYTSASPYNQNKVENFTQMIWRDTKEMGFGLAISKSDRIFVVCTYDPPGNIDSLFSLNVLLPRHHQADDDSQSSNTIMTLCIYTAVLGLIVVIIVKFSK